MIKADVLITNKNWSKYIEIPGLYINKKLKRINKKLNIFKNNNFQFTILLSGNNEVKKLNKKFRKKNIATDILSFPFHEKKKLHNLTRGNSNDIYLGDIIINLNKIIEASKKENFLVIFDKIWIHGLTHLLGYRHKSNRDFSSMQKLEKKIIKFIK